MRASRHLIVLAALLACACDRSVLCLRVEGKPAQTVYALFPPDRGCFMYRTDPNVDEASSVCGNFSVAPGTCPVEPR